MALFLFQGFDHEGAGALRAQTRPDHLAFAAGLGDAIRLAGPMLSEGETPGPVGSFFIIEAESAEAARAMMASDPYALAGVFARVSVTPVRAVLGTWMPAGSP
jgi:uncharacterized protein YciI